MDKTLGLAHFARATRVSRVQPALLARHMSSGPSVVQPSFWKSMIPKPFRRHQRKTGYHPEFLVLDTPKPKVKKDWNPATFFIIIFLFIGSMAIQMIALRREFSAFTRRADVRIGLLREVVEKLQRGEHVDVEKALGTGDAQKELEWEQVLREIERDDIMKNTQKSSKSRSQAAQSVPSRQSAPASTEPKHDAQTKASPDTDGETKVKPVGFSSFF
ncbi:hypothetical protein Micbo1qcDRAFT_8212 [Microdochium bolleyi]|uniref:Uncharacterized protein n=1 Tax=Microdochium bolleyi TaxID=196109 RepID=A0A136JK12_9PEZI|nr:hypothetical protein Micbo1qcDRAFT_8212 [Microdochium bolleyi]